MRVLVTGSEGYIGTVLVHILKERNYDVVGLDTCYLTTRHFVPGIRRYPLIRKDVRDVEIEDVSGFDSIVHLAALSNDPLGAIDPKITDDINHRASVRIAELGRQVGVRRFIFSSSCSIYGAGDSKSLDEDSPFHPLTAYARSKVDTEVDIKEMADSRFSPVFLRNGTAYGLSPRMRFDLVLNNLTGWAFTTGKVTLLSDGSAWRPLVHIRDICSAILAALEAPEALIHNQAFNVGVDQANYQIRQVADSVADIVPNSTVTYADGAETDKRNYHVNFDKIHTVLADFFSPTWSIEEGIEEVYHGSRVTHLTYEEFSGPKYMTILGIKRLVEERRLTEDLRWRE